ncbi:hypothetical protein [Kaistella chaponensis]|uniref:hypothetical protein n=1 Tax=Kaistella chaponensis TaxID=713588 RepID=UPI00117DA9D1|nr:hypothetical protein [Kaistella chaponensis]
MIAFLNCITRAPFSSAIIVLQMTDNHSLIFSIILSGMVFSFLSSMESTVSI